MNECVIQGVKDVYVDIQYASDVSFRLVRQDGAKLGTMYRGYRVLQSPYSLAIFVQKDERTVALYSAYTLKSDEELYSYVDSYVELIENLIMRSGLQSVELYPDCLLIRDYYEKRKRNE